MVYGPERFFYDKGSFTGVHRNGGPSTIDHNRVELSDLMDRSPADARGVKLGTMTGSYKGDAILNRYSRSSSGRDLRASAPAGSSGASKSESYDMVKTTSSKSLSPLRTKSNRYLSGQAATIVNEPGKPLYGPERFFYDKNTFTGVHKNGGPSTIDPLNGLDLKDIMDRSPADVRGVKYAHHGMNLPRALSRGQLMPMDAPKAAPVDDVLLAKGGTGGANLKPLLRTSSGRQMRENVGSGLYGPERFYYDKSSFTGVHKHGGPSTTDNQRVELSNLLNRSSADVRGVNHGTYQRF